MLLESALLSEIFIQIGRKFIYADDIMSRHSRPILQRTGMQSLVRYGADITLPVAT